MKKPWISIAFLALCAVSSAVLADTVRVAVVDVGRLQTEVPQVAKVLDKIKAEFAPRRVKIQAQQDKIARLEQKLRDRENDKSKLSDAEAKSLQRDIRSRTLRLENAQEELESDRRLRRSEAMDRLRRMLSEVIAEVANAEDLDIVLESGVTWASERANITDKVLARMRQLDTAGK